MNWPTSCRCRQSPKRWVIPRTPRHQQRLGTFESTFSRVVRDDVLEKFWALGVILDQIRDGAEHYRRKIGDAR